MRQILVDQALQLILTQKIAQGCVTADLYLQDGDGGFHRVTEVDLLDDRMRCDDGYWELYDWCDDGRLWVEE